MKQQQYILANDTISGKRGGAYMTIDGEYKELKGMKSAEIKTTINTTEYEQVGTDVVQDKQIGQKHTGTITIDYGSPLFNNLFDYFEENGKFPLIDITGYNDDPQSSRGQREVTAYDCVLSGDITRWKTDSGTPIMEQTINFTAAKVKRSKEFNEELSNYGSN